MSFLRVTGGSLKGRRIEVPQGDYEIRPAMDRMRESLFSIFDSLEGKSFLDLFSGSGIIAIEAASRGASVVECVERDRAKLSILIRNVSICPIRVNCHSIPVERFILRCKSSFNFIFLDPPFPYEHKSQLLESISKTNMLLPGGTVAMHYPKENILEDKYGDIVLFDEREYGRSIVRLYKLNTNK